jgi:hypothetical protein
MADRPANSANGSPKSPPKETTRVQESTNGAPRTPPTPNPEQIPTNIATMQFDEATPSNSLDQPGTNKKKD